MDGYTRKCAFCGMLGGENGYGRHCYNCGEDWDKAIPVTPVPEPPPARAPDVPPVEPCPRCNAPLERARGLGASAPLTGCYGCRRCGGVWLDNAASTLVVRRIDPTLMTFAQTYERTAAPPARAEAARRCPIGREPLAKVAVKGITLDVCHVHGTWFDAGELRKVAELFEAERSPQHEALPPDVRRVLETIAGAYRSSGQRDAYEDANAARALASGKEPFDYAKLKRIAQCQIHEESSHRDQYYGSDEYRTIEQYARHLEEMAPWEDTP